MTVRFLTPHALIIVVPVSPPSKDVRGDGATFVFRLSGSDSRAFKWNSSDSELATHNQFIIATADYLAIGGSSAHASNAIRVDADLSTCCAGPSDTFNNPPLAPEESIQPFIIGKLHDVLLLACFGKCVIFCVLRLLLLQGN